MKEKSYVMIKPEFANHPIVIYMVKSRLETAGLKIEEEGFVEYDVDHARAHYCTHIGQDYYPPLEKYITSDKAYGMVVSGENAIAKIRAICGATKNPENGTIRHDIPRLLGLELRVRENVIHSSDSQEAAKKEIMIFQDLKKHSKENNQSK